MNGKERHNWWGLGERREIEIVVEGGWAEEMRKNKNKVLPLDFVR